LLGADQRGGVASTLPRTVLVVEENAAVQELIDQTLRESGHRVLTTRNALEALEVVRRVRIDVLIVGLLLDERGQALVGEFRSIQPGMAIVSISGSDDLDGIDHCARLSRPFSLDDLREAATSALDSRRGDSPIEEREVRLPDR
jgi:DNA-binding NtrC family response regulator